MASPAVPPIISPTHQNVFVHFFHVVGSLFTTVKSKVSSVFISLFGADAAAKFSAGVHALLESDLGVLALDAVNAVASLKLGGAESRAAAFSKLVEDAKAKGIEASESIYNMLIEVALQKVKGNVGVESVTPAAPVPAPETPAAPAAPSV